MAFSVYWFLPLYSGDKVTELSKPKNIFFFLQSFWPYSEIKLECLIESRVEKFRRSGHPYVPAT